MINLIDKGTVCKTFESEVLCSPDKGALVKFVNENQHNWDVDVLLSSAALFYLAKDQNFQLRMYCKTA